MGSLNEIVISSVDQIDSKDGGDGLTERRDSSGAGVEVNDLIVINIAINIPISPADKSKIQFFLKNMVVFSINNKRCLFFISVK